jgi:altronate hydrolase
MTARPNRPPTLRLAEGDPLVVALADLARGDPLGEGGLAAAEPIPRGHKVATRAIAAGEPVRKYGQVIGQAAAPIGPGAHIHTHNVAFVPSVSDHAIGTARTRPAPPAVPASFAGIVRPDGSVATRNYIGVLTTVNCAATVGRLIAEEFRRTGALDAFPNVDGVVALTHQYGCAAGEAAEATACLRRVLGGHARHPNFAAVVIVGLGCETNGIDRLLGDEGLEGSPRIHRLLIQEEGGTRATVARGSAAVREHLADANAVRRQPVPARHLTVGLQCGGSDGFSGITANPALGVAADLLVAHGGTAILSETPEIYGAEHLLLSRAATPDVGRTLLDLLAWWEGYAARHGESLGNNPSPGNHAGGITTILEKSLGAVAKGGSSDLVEVLRYAEPPSRPGLVFMDSPGYDPVSATGQVAAGANLIAFTTGRGSCFGCRPAPAIKLATNTPMYRRMQDDMDLNCGTIAEGTESVAEVGRAIFELMLAVASGERTASERLGYGADEFAPWHFGATL